MGERNDDEILSGEVDRTGAHRPPVTSEPDLVDEWGMESFPASDPPQAWIRERTRP